MNQPPNGINYTPATSPGTGFASTPFILAADSSDTDIAALFTGSTTHYYIDLGAKDAINLFTNVGDPTPFITMSAGRALAFFNDADMDGIVESNELTGISIAAGTSMYVGFGVNGDIITSLDAKTGEFYTNLIGDTQSIKKLTLNGGAGNILAGGSITDVTAGYIGLIGSGTVGNGMNFDLGGVGGAGSGVLDPIVLAAKKAGPSISKINVVGLDGISASNGGAGGLGGSISTVTVQSDTDGFTLQAGNGGNAATPGNGGAGGKISQVVVWGDLDLGADDLISIKAGNGGTGMGTGSGGVGGLVEKIYVGYKQTGSSYTKSDFFLQDHVEIIAGDGGLGKSGANGGAITNVNVRVSPSGMAGDGILVQAGDGGDANNATGKGGNGGNVTSYFLLNNYQAIGGDPYSDVVVTGGDGGYGVAATGGNGGTVTKGVILAESLDVHAGDGGDGGKKGGTAGSLTDLQISAPGQPSLIQFGQQESNIRGIYAESVILGAGAGGDALVNGSGGNGGAINKVVAPITDLAIFTVNGGTGGNGGNGTGANGGNGGLVTGLSFDSDADSTNEVTAILRSGDGGVGTKKGGNGGDFTISSFLISDSNLGLTSGSGGQSSAGAGGNGGAVKSVTLVSSGLVSGVNGVATLQAGNGGDAMTSGKGGNGGALANVAARALGDVLVSSGTGGATDTGTAGSGGDISTAILAGGDLNTDYSFNQIRDVTYDSSDPFLAPTVSYMESAGPVDGSAVLVAGSGGVDLVPATAVKGGGKGGSISNASIQGIKDLTIAAGDGTLGGVGGDVKTSVAAGGAIEILLITNSTDTSLGTTDTYYAQRTSGNVGDISITAGNGGDGPKAGGKGGSLITVNSATSFLSTAAVSFAAGAGGDGANGAGGAGGAVTTFIVGSGLKDFNIAAGDGGDSMVKAAGGVGGSVTGLSVGGRITETDIMGSGASITVMPMLKSVVAGDGGDTATGTKGAVGGSISKVNVSGDIGVRYGADFGLTTMGGIFAGAGGTSAGTKGAAGNVTEVTADFISSIVAGRAMTPQMVSKVDQIYLDGLENGLKPQANGSFNYLPTTVGVAPNEVFYPGLDAANFVGGFSGNPGLAGSSNFKVVGEAPFTDPITPWDAAYVPLDGLVAALVKGKTNVAFNAWLTNDANGDAVLVSGFNS